jgi:hypothetical protein
MFKTTPSKRAGMARALLIGVIQVLSPDPRITLMNSVETPPDLEICPGCSQPTAPEFFRSVGTTRLCALCTRRAGKEAQSREARALDARYHGGLGWLWKHIGLVACSTIGVVIFRLVLLHVLKKL